MRTAAEEHAGARSEVLRAALAVLALALFWLVPWAFTPPDRAWGWDESMHAELPALAMLAAAQDGDAHGAFRALHDCNQYPFAWPLALALVQAATGVSELACRVAGTLAWCATLFGLFLLGRELTAAQRRASGSAGRGDALVPWLALGLGALCPLGLAYAGTLFLEVPFALVMTFALRAWLRRDGRARRELAAGAWLTLAFFMKFNYGLLLGFGVFLAWLVEFAEAMRKVGARPFLARSVSLAVLPTSALAWWLFLPFPEGLDVAARHRDALADFLRGNLELAPTPWGVRALHWAGYFAPGVVLLALELVGALRTLPEAGRPGARALWLVLLGGGIPLLLHPFHLDRFLLFFGPPLWSLAALGLGRLLPDLAHARAVVLASVGALALALLGADVRWIAERSGLAPADAERRSAQEETFAGWRRLDAHRPLPTAGLARAEADALLALVTVAARPDERVGWLGLSSELSPAAIHIALLAAGGSRARFRSDAHQPMDVTFEGRDPGWDAQRFREYASAFDVIFTTDPPDLRARAARDFVRSYQARLVGELGWVATELGTVELARPLQAPLAVRVLACRPNP